MPLQVDDRTRARKETLAEEKATGAWALTRYGTPPHPSTHSAMETSLGGTPANATASETPKRPPRGTRLARQRRLWQTSWRLVRYTRHSGCRLSEHIQEAASICTDAKCTLTREKTSPT